MHMSSSAASAVTIPTWTTARSRLNFGGSAGRTRLRSASGPTGSTSGFGTGRSRSVRQATRAGDKDLHTLRQILAAGPSDVTAGPTRGWMEPQPGAARQVGQPVMRAGACFLQAVGVLVLFTIARALGLLGPSRYVYVSVSLLVVALVLIAWRAGATRADVGLSRTDVPAGVRYGAGAFGIVLLFLVVAAVIPATSGFLHDARAQISGGRLLYELGVSIVLLEAIPEEFAFRGVLLGSALRIWGPWRASLITSALFGLWHIEPTLHTMSDNRAVAGASASVGGQVLVVLGAVAVTFVAGLVFCWLRLRSRSLIAPVMAHVATNGLALTVAWFTVHRGSLR
jgi:uncharacterized protein